MPVSRFVKIAHLSTASLKTLAVMVPLVCAACVPAAAQITATIDIDTTTTVPVHAGFSGVNVDLGFPLEYWDYRFNTLAARVGYGWVRFPGGSSGDIYNWQTG